MNDVEDSHAQQSGTQCVLDRLVTCNLCNFYHVHYS